MEKTTHKLQQLLKMHIFAKATISSLFRTTNVGLFISNCHDLCGNTFWWMDGYCTFPILVHGICVA